VPVLLKTATKAYGKGQNLTYTPAIPTTQPIVTKICIGEYVRDTDHPAKFYPDRFHFHASATSRTKMSTELFLLRGSIIYSQDAITDINAKYVKLECGSFVDNRMI